MFTQGLGFGIGFSVGVGLMVFGFMVVYTLALIFTRLPYVRDVIAYLKPLEDPEWEKEYDKFQKDCVSLVRQLTRLNEKSTELDANVGNNQVCDKSQLVADPIRTINGLDHPDSASSLDHTDPA